MIQRHPRDPAATRDRLLQAALAEFAEHGLAGARIDRIATRAETNKRMIYSYYGNKQQLFEQVLDACGTAFNEAVPFSVADLPGYAVAMFDELAADPLLMAALARRDLEGAEPTALELEAYRQRVQDIDLAQREGVVRGGIAPVDLLAAIEALAHAALRTRVGIRGVDARPADLRRREARDALAETVRRLTAP